MFRVHHWLDFLRLSWQRRRRFAREARVRAIQRELDEQGACHHRQIEELKADHRRELAAIRSELEIVVQQRDLYIEIVERERERVAMETASFAQRTEAARLGLPGN